MSSKEDMKVHYSSKSNEWDTPQGFYNRLNEHYNFTLDPCATDYSAKCEKYYTEKDDGLSKSWAGETVFMNPPYGREIGKWLKKAHDETKNNKGTTVVCLIPSRTDTKYWHQYCMQAHELYFVKGRLKFGNKQADTSSGKNNPAPFPSVVVVFKSGYTPLYGGNNPKLFTMTNSGVQGG